MAEQKRSEHQHRQKDIVQGISARKIHPSTLKTRKSQRPAESMKICSTNQKKNLQMPISYQAQKEPLQLCDKINLRSYADRQINMASVECKREAYMKTRRCARDSVKKGS